MKEETEKMNVGGMMRKGVKEEDKIGMTEEKEVEWEGGDEEQLEVIEDTMIEEGLEDQMVKNGEGEER